MPRAWASAAILRTRGRVGELRRQRQEPRERPVRVAAERVLGLQEGHLVGAGGRLGAGLLGGEAGGVRDVAGLDRVTLLALGEQPGLIRVHEGREDHGRDQHRRGRGDRQGGPVAPPVAAEQLARRVRVGRDELPGLEPLEVVGHLLGGAVAGRGVAGHRLVHDRGELVGQLRREQLDAAAAGPRRCARAAGPTARRGTAARPRARGRASRRARTRRRARRPRRPRPARAACTTASP
jgi:hypothetical protein